MARPTTARADPAPLVTAPPVAGGVGVPLLPVGPTGVLEPEAVAVAVPLEGGGTTEPEGT
jgi:hypothetical protein